MKKGANHYRPSKQRYWPSPAAKVVPRTSAPDSNKTPGERAKNNQPPNPHLDRALVKWTKFVGIFTGVLAVVGGLQFWAFVQSERAFLSPVSLTINGGFPQAGDRSTRVFLQMRNGGRTTAFPKHAVIGLRIGALPTTAEYGNERAFPMNPTPADAVLNASDNVVLSRPLTQSDIDSVKAGANRMSVFGYVIYSDSFWLFGDRTTGFCFTYTPDPTGASQFVTCPEQGYTYAN